MAIAGNYTTNCSNCWQLRWVYTITTYLYWIVFIIASLFHLRFNLNFPATIYCQFHTNFHPATNRFLATFSIPAACRTQHSAAPQNATKISFRFEPQMSLSAIFLVHLQFWKFEICQFNLVVCVFVVYFYVQLGVACRNQIVSHQFGRNCKMLLPFQVDVVVARFWFCSCCVGCCSITL